MAENTDINLPNKLDKYLGKLDICGRKIFMIITPTTSTQKWVCGYKKMGCYNCARGKCTFHDGSTKLATGISYTKEFRVFDLQTNEQKIVKLRPKERKKQPLIEIEEKHATCTKCRVMRDCYNYFIISRSGTANVCICQFCTEVQFANDTELFGYVKQKLLKRYNGSDPDLRKLLR